MATLNPSASARGGPRHGALGAGHRHGRGDRHRPRVLTARRPRRTGRLSGRTRTGPSSTAWASRIAFRGFRTSSGPERRIRAALASVSLFWLVAQVAWLIQSALGLVVFPLAVRPRDVRGDGPRSRRPGPRRPPGGRSTRTARSLSRLRDHIPGHRDRRDPGLRAPGRRPRPARGDAAPQLPDRVPVHRRRRLHRGARHPREPTRGRPLRAADRDVPLRPRDTCSGWPPRRPSRRRDTGRTTCSRSGRWPSALPVRRFRANSRDRARVDPLRDVLP